MTRRYFGGLVRLGPAVLAFASLGLASCSERMPTYRYRMTVEVTTPEGLRSGSSVIEIRQETGTRFPGPEAASLKTYVTGEAVAVDLPGGQTVFALLRTPEREDGAGSYALAAFAPNLPDVHRADWRERVRVLKQQDGSAILPRDQYPMFVSFRDIRNPQTVEQVPPERLIPGADAAVSVRRVIIQITTDNVTRTIEDKLPWLRSLNGRYLHGGTSARGAPLGLHAGNFSQDE